MRRCLPQLLEILLVCTCFAMDAIALPQSTVSAENVEHLRSAAQFLLHSDLKHAEDEVQLVLAEIPDDYRALNLLGIIRVQEGRREEAQAIFEKVIRIKPGYAGAHVSLGLLLAESGHADQAIDELESALKIEPGREDATKPLVQLLREQARAALKEREPEKSLSFLMRARKVAPDDPDLRYEFGMVALRMSLFEDAKLAFEQVLTVRPVDANAIYALGRAQMGLGKIQATRELFEKYVQLRPDDPSGHFGLGLVLHMLETSDEEARKQFERSIELQPAQTEAYVQLGFLDIDSNELERATRRFQAVLQRAPQNAGAQLGIGIVQFLRKDYPAAEDSLRSAIAVDPATRESHYYLGLTYARLGKSAESAEQLEIARKLEREDLDRHRIILRLLSPDEAESLDKAKQ
jgi:tetratricopeptide (TPR) repeat protein